MKGLSVDLDKAFVSSLLETGPNGLKVAFDKGVTADLLIDEGQRAFEFAVDYLKNYGSFPTPDILDGKLGITLDDTQQAPLEFYADEIINRRLHSRLSEGMREGVKYLELNDPKAAYEQLAGVVYKLRTDNLAGSRVVSVPFLGDDVLEYYRKIKAGERGVLTPWDSLNEATFGFWPEDLILFVSRTGVGKTWLSLIMAHYAWTQGKRVLFVTTEVAKLSMGIRWVALANQLSYAELRHGRLTSQDEHKMVQGVDDFKKIDGFYMVGGDFDFRIESLELSIGEVNPDLVIADGAYLLKSDGNSRTEKAANVFDELKRVAKRCAVPLIITTQFNREVKSGSKAQSMKAEKIALSDVAGWNADQIYALYQTEEMKADKRMGFHPMKIREGMAADWETRWDLDLMDFSEIGAPGAPGGGDAADYDTGIGSDPGGDSTDDSDLPF